MHSVCRWYAGCLCVARNAVGDNFRLASVRRTGARAGSTAHRSAAGASGLHSRRGRLAGILAHYAAQYSVGTALWRVAYFARALGEFGAVLVVSGSVSRLTETATLFIFRSLDDRNEVGAYAMALALALISFTVLMAVEYFKRHVEED